MAKHTQGWRDVLPVHPACELFPPMSREELLELGKDIKANGLKFPFALWRSAEGERFLLDGRNRLDAMELVGIKTVNGQELRYSGARKTKEQKFFRWFSISPDHDPYAYVLSMNIHRRHLTAEQRRDLIAKLLKAKPEQSNRQVAKQVKADDKTVAKVRSELESTADIPQLEKTKGKDGKERPAKRKQSPPAQETRQEDYYTIAAEAVERMSAATRVRFFAHIRERSSTDELFAAMDEILHRMERADVDPGPDHWRNSLEVVEQIEASIQGVREYVEERLAWPEEKPAADDDGTIPECLQRGAALNGGGRA